MERRERNSVPTPRRRGRLHRSRFRRSCCCFVCDVPSLALPAAARSGMPRFCRYFRAVKSASIGTRQRAHSPSRRRLSRPRRDLITLQTSLKAPRYTVALFSDPLIKRCINYIADNFISGRPLTTGRPPSRFPADENNRRLIPATRVSSALPIGVP